VPVALPATDGLVFFFGRCDQHDGVDTWR